MLTVNSHRPTLLNPAVQFSRVIIIIIIMWLVQWTLPFPRATSMPVDFVLDDKQLPDQCLVERHQTQLCGAKFDEVGLICGSSPMVRGPH